MSELLRQSLLKNGLLTAFALVGALMGLSYLISTRLTRGRLHGSALAVFGGLVLAYVGDMIAGGKNGLADVPMFAGIGLMGDAMLRDFAIVATAFGANFSELKKSGLPVVIGLFAGVLVSFGCGAVIAVAFGYHDAVSVTTIAAGAVTYIIGPVIFARVHDFLAKLRAATPDTRIVFVSIIRAPDKRAHWADVDTANRLVRELCAAEPHCRFVDVNPAVFGADGEPRMEFYKEDKLHYFPPAYTAFTKIVKPVVAAAWAEVSDGNAASPRLP